MFYALHRLVKYFCMLVLLACLVWAYTMRAALQPLWVWYDVYENGGLEKTDRLPTMTGEGIGITDGHTFQMKTDGRFYAVRLTGFDLPEPPLTPAQIDREKRRREFLRAAVVGKPVRVEVTYSNQNSVLGIVYTGTTNLNTYYVAHDLSHFNREYVKTTPRDLQYKFFAAARAKNQELAANQSTDH